MYAEHLLNEINVRSSEPVQFRFSGKMSFFQLRASSEIKGTHEIFAVDPVDVLAAASGLAAAGCKAGEPFSYLLPCKQIVPEHRIHDGRHPLILFITEDMRTVLQHG